jgi:hypothetical protein
MPERLETHFSSDCHSKIGTRIVNEQNFIDDLHRHLGNSLAQSQL